MKLAAPVARIANQEQYCMMFAPSVAAAACLVFGVLNSRGAAMSVSLSITTEEARALLACLGFVRHNIVLDARSLRFRFVSGKPLDLSIRQAIHIDCLLDRIEEETEIAINTRPFNPYFNFN